MADPDNIQPIPLGMFTIVRQPVGLRRRESTTNSGDDQGDNNGPRRDSAAFIEPENPTVSDQRYRRNSRATLVGDHTGIYWRTPAKMVFFFFVGLAGSIAHHVYYSIRNGDLAQNRLDQEWALRFVYLVHLRKEAR
jgi:hypothetical protein